MPKGISKEKILQDVGGYYKSPEKLLTDEHFNVSDKIDFLKQWEYDLNLVMVATEENMTAPQSMIAGEMARDVRKILAKLSGDTQQTENLSPAKVGGIEERKKT